MKKMNNIQYRLEFLPQKVSIPVNADIFNAPFYHRVFRILSYIMKFVTNF